MGAFDNLGQALRWLRNRQQRKQYEIAEAAGITKAMLSAYETGKQNPAVETLDKLLSALDADLSDLHDALVLNQGGRRSPVLGGPPPSVSALAVAGERSDPLPEEWQRPLSQVLGGLEALVRQVHEELQATPEGPQALPRPEGGSGPPGPRRIDALPPTGGDEEE